MPPKDPNPWLSFRQIGMGGLNTLKDPQDLQDNESPTMLNTVYDDGIIRPRLGSILDIPSPVALSVADSFPQNGDHFALGTNVSHNYAQAFTAVGGTLQKVVFYAGFTGTPPTSGKSLFANVYTHVGTFGSGAMPGSLIATSFAVLTNTIQDPGGAITFTFPVSQQVALTGGTHYFVSIQYGDASMGDLGSFHVFGLQSGGTAPGNSAWSYDGANWVTGSGFTTPSTDISFAVYESLKNASPTQLMKAQDSHGDDYLIAVYGTQFFVRDPGPPGTTGAQQLILLNDLYSPLNFGLVYGYDTWHAGVGNDRFYFCNGVDSVMKWPVGIEYLKNPVGPSDTTITLVDSTEFGSSGTIIIVNDNGTRSILGFTANNTTNGMLTLSGAFGANASPGNPVTSTMLQMGVMPIGKVVRVASPQSYARLFIANTSQAENTLHYSQAGDPESFSVTLDLNSGGSRQITKGEGGILDIEDFGEFLVVVKHNALLSYTFQINASLGAFVDNYTNLVQGTSLNPIVGQVNITAENALFMPTESEGIFQIVPSTSGSQSSTQLTPISNNIFDTLRENISFDSGRVEVHHRKIYWACTTLNSPNVADPTKLTNDIVLVYDLLWNQWGIFNNWDAVDIRESNDELYFLSKDDGAIYQAFVDYQDARGGTVIGYDTELWTKRFDFGKPSEVKTLKNPIYIEGFIDPTTKITVKVLYNEGGSLGQQNFIIDGSNPIYVQQIPQESLGLSPMGFPGLGGENPAIGAGPVLGSFRVYLDASQSYGFFNIQLQFSTSEPGSNWMLGGIGFNLNHELQIPRELCISPSS